MNQDEFLKPAKLFKKGPIFLMVVGVLLSFFIVFAALWRIEAGKVGVFESAHKLMSTSAIAASSSVSDTLYRLEYLAKIASALTTEDKEFIPNFKNLLAKESLIYTHIKTVELKKGLSSRTVVFKNNLVYLELPLKKENTYLRIELDFKDKFKDALATIEDYKGAVKLIDSFENEILISSYNFKEIEENYIFKKEDFMKKELDFNSAKKLAFKTKNNLYGFYVLVLIPEKEYLVEFKKRVYASWLIGGSVILVILSLVSITGYSLYKFSKEESHLRKLATIDILTDLPNRRSFKTLLSNFIAEQNKTPFALMFIDLDDFKFINDSVGHDQGDVLLKRTASAIKSVLRPGDRVCRLGGDEFTVLVRDVKVQSEAEEIAKRLIIELKKTINIGGLELSPKSSIGIVLCPEHSQKEEDLLRFADIAMYKAKKDGKGAYCVFNESLRKVELENIELVNDLKEGLRLKQLYLVYQPKYSIVQGFKSIEGVEALIRWKHPTKGLISPAKFIPLAESHGLIGEIGSFVIHAAVDQIQEWYKKGFGWVRVAINISALQLKDKDFVFKLTRLLAQKGVPPYCLQIEITESILAEDSHRLKDLISDLNTFGIKVALDDFGTGYSCLSYLQQFPIDYLKIDRSFVNNIKTKQGAAICATIVQLSKAVNAKTIAEGVEDAEQLNLLLDMGCDQIQGFYLSKPLEVKDLEIQLLLQNII